MRLLVGIFCSLCFVCGCARQLSSNVYSGQGATEVAETYSGVIVNVRHITVQEGDKLEDNTLGLIGGGITGAVLGSQIGKGGGNSLAMLGGTLIGATAGAMGEKALKQQEAVEYIVTLDNGLTKTVVQAGDAPLAVGQKVFVLISSTGRSRLVAKNA